MSPEPPRGDRSSGTQTSEVIALPSALRPLRSDLCPLSSALRSLSSVLRPLSVLHPSLITFLHPAPPGADPSTTAFAAASSCSMLVPRSRSFCNFNCRRFISITARFK